MKENDVKDYTTTIPKIGIEENTSTDLENKGNGQNLKQLWLPRKKREKKIKIEIDSITTSIYTPIYITTTIPTHKLHYGTTSGTTVL